MVAHLSRTQVRIFKLFARCERGMVLPDHLHTEPGDKNNNNRRGQKINIMHFSPENCNCFANSGDSD